MNSNRIKVVLTGASGFLGSNIIQKLKDKDKFRIYALSSKGRILQQKNDNLNVIYLDKEAILHDEYKSILNEAIVVNCAFPRNSTGIGMGEGLKYIQELFSNSVKADAKAIINISSQSVYSSKREEPVDENVLVCPETPYAVGKYSMELLLETACEASNTVYTNIRLASLIGEGFNQRIVNRFVKKALETHMLNVNNNQQIFGFMDIDDAVTGILRLLDTNPKKWKPVYNLGIDQGYTLIEIAKLVKKVLKETMNIDTKIKIVSGTESSNSSINASLFNKDFDFLPAVSLESSIRKISEGYLK